MILALVVALAAIAIGLGLGLFPVASRRALGPLRTLALAAVIGVAVLHLLPEAFATLGLVGLIVFAAGLALPRWAGRLNRGAAHARLGLEFGFFGLVIHHVGDGLALGVYSRMDDGPGHSHADVLLALVLHTVPLVAVVSAGYARARGARAAITRSAMLAAASAAGIFAAGLVPEALVEQVQAWIAAGVAGLLLHGMSHDMTEDLPKSTAGRLFDFAAALGGLAIGWVGASLDAHHEPSTTAVLDAGLLRVALDAAFPVLLGLALGALLMRTPAASRGSRLFVASRPELGMVLGPELFLLSFCGFGWSFALVLHVLLLGAVVSASPAPDTQGSAAFRPMLALFTERLDAATPWAFAGVAAATVLGASVPAQALAPLGTVGSVALVLFLSIGLPVHALLAPLLGAALVGKGLSPMAALVLCLIGPLLVRPRSLGLALPAVAVALGVALLLGGKLPLHAMPVDPRLSWGALVVLVSLVLVRIYRLGFRGWLAPLGPDDEADVHIAAASHAEPVHEEREV